MILFHQLIHAGKGEAIRIRAILRSLIPIEDLVGVISIPFLMPTLAKGLITLHYNTHTKRNVWAHLQLCDNINNQVDNSIEYHFFLLCVQTVL